MEDKNIIISTRSIIFGILFAVSLVVGLAVLWFIKDVLVYIFIALILTLAFEPFVDALVRRKIPRTISALLVIFSFFFVLGGLGSVAVVPFILDIEGLIASFPVYADNALKAVRLSQYGEQMTQSFVTQFSQASGMVLTATLGFFSGALSLMVTAIFTVYMMLDFHKLRIKFIELFPNDQRKDVKRVLIAVETKLGDWLRGQFFLMVIIGVATYIGLIIIDVPYALALAVIAGLFEVVPVIGPIIGTIPALLVGFGVNPVVGVAVLVLYLLLQQLENNIIVPKVMQKAVGFNPIITIMALMIGSNLLGITGAIIAVPFAIIIFETIKYIVDFTQRSRP